MAKRANGQGHVSFRTRKDGTKSYRIEFPYEDENGVQQYERRSGFRNEKACFDYRDKFLRDLALRGGMPDKKVMLPDIVELWIQKEAGRAPASQLQYKATLNHHIRPRLNVRVDLLTTDHLRKALAGTQAALPSKGRSGNATNRAILTVVKASLRWAARRDVREIKFNPLEGIPLSNLVNPPGQRNALLFEDVNRLVQHTAGTQFGVLWRLYAATGMRRSEALALNWDQVDFHQGVIHVRNTKTKRDRDVAMGAGLADMLKTLKTDRAAGRHDPVFVGMHGRRLATGVVRSHWVSDCRAAGLPEGVTLHQLRHFFATEALTSGEHGKSVSQMLGHSSITTTHTIYDHVIDGEARGIAERMDSRFDEGA